MDEDKVIRPMDFVRLTSIDKSNVIKDTKNHIGLVKEVSPLKRVSVIWIGNTYSKVEWFSRRELSKEDLFEYAEEMRKCLDKIFDLAIDERLK